jgi:hypothetical protein
VKSNATHSVEFASARATVSGYKLNYKDEPYLRASWEKSILFWTDTMLGIIKKSSEQGVKLELAEA